jgi:hypothetical protein
MARSWSTFLDNAWRSRDIGLEREIRCATAGLEFRVAKSQS